LDAEPEVVTTAGVVRGQWEGAVTVFRGIPYA
jgi:carboxylesterase type B